MDALKLLGADQAVAWHSYKLIHVSAWKFWLPSECFPPQRAGLQSAFVGNFLCSYSNSGDFLVCLFAILRSSHTMRYLPKKDKFQVIKEISIHFKIVRMLT